MKQPDVHQERPCKQCGKLFKPQSSRNVFCSGRCCRAWKQVAQNKQIAGQGVKSFQDKAMLPEEVVRIRQMRTSDRDEEDVDLDDVEPLPMRPCHDCGKPTTNYRCRECWVKFKRKYAANFV